MRGGQSAGQLAGSHAPTGRDARALVFSRIHLVDTLSTEGMDTTALWRDLWGHHSTSILHSNVRCPGARALPARAPSCLTSNPLNCQQPLPLPGFFTLQTSRHGEHVLASIQLRPSLIAADILSRDKEPLEVGPSSLRLLPPGLPPRALSCLTARPCLSSLHQDDRTAGISGTTTLE